MTQYAFVQAHWYHKGRRGHNGDGKIHGAVAHSMEAPEKGETAESTARFFANGSGGRPSSADWCFDSNSGVECVKPEDEAYHAPPASHWTRGYEHAGYARQTAADWHDPFSWAMLQLSGAKLGEESRQFGFPLVYLDQDDLRAGKIDGVTMHNDVSQVFHQSQHWDPGPGFPMAEWLEIAKNGAHTVAPPKAKTVMKLGDHGAGVAFLADMENILAAAGFAINRDGRPSKVQLPVPSDPAKRANFFYDNHVRERTAEVQRFGVKMWELAGKKGKKPTVDGIAGAETASLIAFWVPVALTKLKKH